MNDLTVPAIVTIALLIMIYKYWSSSILESLSLTILVLCGAYLIPNSPSEGRNLLTSPPAKIITETQCFRYNVLSEVIKIAR